MSLPLDVNEFWLYRAFGTDTIFDANPIDLYDGWPPPLVKVVRAELYERLEKENKELSDLVHQLLCSVSYHHPSCSIGKKKYAEARAKDLASLGR